MLRKLLTKTAAITAVSAVMASASANSVGFTQSIYVASAPTIEVTVAYDFSDFAMFGGGLDLVYDSSALEFVSFTQAELASDAQAAASPVGLFAKPGLYQGFGVGTFEFFNGMTSAGDMGTFVFNLVSSPSLNTPCGELLCLVPNAINPFVSLDGVEVSDLLLDNGISAAAIFIPVPAAVWLMLSGLGALFGLARKTRS